MMIFEEAAKLIAFYLPQYHPIPENDAWWGRGFTEWINVAKARPRFRGHYQPHLPADLGFYDLRVPEVREAQAELARDHGIYGFCYYHYWFKGQRLLERVFDEVLESGKPDYPFCLCWANHNWTRSWDGRDQEILMEQRYSAEDDINHLRYLAQAFVDERYIRINGKPLFLVFRAALLPDPQATTDRWREEAHRLGIGELFLCRVENLLEWGDPAKIGFDASVEFHPKLNWFNGLSGPWWSRLYRRGINKWYAPNLVYSYQRYVEIAKRNIKSPYPRLPGLCAAWDNSARVQSGVILKDATPEKYKEWLQYIVDTVKPLSSDGLFVFINAWNEWAEGAHLEPCQRWGRAYLEATRDVVLSNLLSTGQKRTKAMAR